MECTRFYAEARLADAARADQRYQAMLFDQRGDLGDLRLATDKRSYLRRQVVGKVFERTQRRKVGDQVRREQLVDAFGLREVFEPVLAQIAQAALRGRLSLEEFRAGPREQHLAA